MKQGIFKNLKLALGVGFGVSIHQYFFMTDGAFDFYQPLVAFAFTFVVSSIGALLRNSMELNQEPTI